MFIVAIKATTKANKKRKKKGKWAFPLEFVHKTN